MKTLNLTDETTDLLKEYYSDFQDDYDCWFENETNNDFLLNNDDPYKDLKEKDERSLIEAYNLGFNYTELPDLPDMKDGDYKYTKQEELPIDGTTYFGEASVGMGKPKTY
jgi:hypothetical protein